MLYALDPLDLDGEDLPAPSLGDRKKRLTRLLGCTFPMLQSSASTCFQRRLSGRLALDPRRCLAASNILLHCSASRRNAVSRGFILGVRDGWRGGSPSGASSNIDDWIMHFGERFDRTRAKTETATQKYRFVPSSRRRGQVHHGCDAHSLIQFLHCRQRPD